MGIIYLTQDKITQVNDEHLNYLNQWNWCAHKNKYTYYAVRNSSRVNGRQTTILMHRVISERIGLIGLIDHKDRDGLNNLDENLRIATPSQNNVNQRTQSNNISGYKGVSWYRYINKWRAEICRHGVTQHLGYFNTKEEAAIVYNQAAIRLFGDRAVLNVIKQIIPIDPMSFTLQPFEDQKEEHNQD